MNRELDFITLISNWFASASGEAKALLVASFLLLTVGNTALIFFSTRRRGVSFVKAMLPTAEGFELALDMNKIELTIFIVLTVISSILASVGFIIGGA